MNSIKLIHQIWYDIGKGKDIPDKYKEYQKTWLKYFPNAKYILWNEKMGDELMYTKYNKYYDAYKNIKYPIMKIDILRYCILYHYGGMYIDMDYKCLDNFDDYLNKHINKIIFINEQPNQIFNTIYRRKLVSNSMIISTKPHIEFWNKLIDECFRRICTFYDIHHVYYVMKTTGPGMLNEIINNFNDKNNYIHILPSGQFNFCNDCNICNPSKTDKLYAIHDYISYWNKPSWLSLRKIISCNQTDIIFYIIMVVLFYLIYKFILKK